MLLSLTLATFAQSRKSVAILGDSYSTFEGYNRPEDNIMWYFQKCDTTRTDVKSVDQTWWHKFVKENGYKLECNNSFSGATICNTGYRKEDYSDRSFVTRMKNLGSPDMILIFGGTNDSWAKSPVGEYKYENWTDKDLYSFRPAMAYMLKTMKEYYPNTEIYFMLNANLSDQIDESAKQICKHYDIPLIELVDIDCKRSHPTVKGMESIARQVTGFIRK